jgi:FkbM family methyltransferase
MEVVIVCYNNYKYVNNIIKQLERFEGLKLIVMDNKSTDLNTIKYLNNLDNRIKVFFNETNNGPWISPFDNVDVYNTLSDKYIVTDPDLQFNKNLPSNFIEVLSELSDTYKCHKIGFAIDISDFKDMYQGIYTDTMTIYDWEIQFWKDRIPHEKYELYRATTDTTFSLINKNHDSSNLSNNLRIAGDFTCKHIPWYIPFRSTDNIPFRSTDNVPTGNVNHFNVYETYKSNNSTWISTSASMIYTYIHTNFIKVQKNNELFFIPKNDENVDFWNIHYNTWENETFYVFDQFLSVDKIFIDIGAWVGTTGMYGSRKSKHVYCIEADKKSFEDMTINFKNNCENNYTLINNAIYNIDDNYVQFGKNKFLIDSKLNDSTSQIYSVFDYNNTSAYFIKTITVNTLLKNIDKNEISLIKVDIEGGEEYILEELIDLYIQHKIPMYISFHYTWWNNKDLGRFKLLSDLNKEKIINNPFISILFP